MSEHMESQLHACPYCKCEYEDGRRAVVKTYIDGVCTSCQASKIACSCPDYINADGSKVWVY